MFLQFVLVAADRSVPIKPTISATRTFMTSFAHETALVLVLGLVTIDVTESFVDHFRKIYEMLPSKIIFLLPLNIILGDSFYVF